VSPLHTDSLCTVQDSEPAKDDRTKELSPPDSWAAFGVMGLLSQSFFLPWLLCCDGEAAGYSVMAALPG